MKYCFIKQFVCCGGESLTNLPKAVESVASMLKCNKIQNKVTIKLDDINKLRLFYANYPICNNKKIEWWIQIYTPI